MAADLTIRLTLLRRIFHQSTATGESSRMNYRKHYDALIERAQSRVLSGYAERHHVVPRCVGGSDKRTNIVRLTPEEHYVAHQLLVKIYPGIESLVWAVMIMTGGADHQPRKNKLYGWLRRRVADQMTGKTKSPETRAKLAAANRGKPFTPERCAAISAGKIGKKTGPASEQRRARIAAALTGKRLSAEHRAAISRAHRGKTLTLSHREKVAAAHRGTKRSPEARAAMVAAWKLRKERAQNAHR